MASDRARELFPTAGDAYRYCQKHGLEISMVNDQLWDIAEALYNASQSSSSSVLMKAEGVTSASYSDSDDCICCEGNHRYGVGVDWVVDYGPYAGESGKGRELYDMVHRFIREMPEKQRVEVVFGIKKD